MAGSQRGRNRNRGDHKRFTVVGIDPGTRQAAFVALDSQGRLVLRRHLTLAGELLSRLAALYGHTVDLLARTKAAIVAVENPLHRRNPHTADLLSRAVGVVELAATQRGLIVLEYRPAQVRALVQEVGHRYDVRRWSPDEQAACAVALRALQEPIELG